MRFHIKVAIERRSEDEQETREEDLALLCAAKLHQTTWTCIQDMCPALRSEEFQVQKPSSADIKLMYCLENLRSAHATQTLRESVHAGQGCRDVVRRNHPCQTIQLRSRDRNGHL